MTFQLHFSQSLSITIACSYSIETRRVINSFAILPLEHYHLHVVDHETKKNKLETGLENYDAGIC